MDALISDDNWGVRHYRIFIMATQITDENLLIIISVHQVFQKSLNVVGSQVSEVMMLGQLLKDSCSDKDDVELDQRLKELATLWSQLNSDLQQRIQYLQGILLRLGMIYVEYFLQELSISNLGQFHDDLRQLLTWMDKLNNQLKTAPAPGVEPPAIENNIAQLQVRIVLCW